MADCLPSDVGFYLLEFFKQRFDRHLLSGPVGHWIWQWKTLPGSTPMLVQSFSSHTQFHRPQVSPSPALKTLTSHSSSTGNYPFGAEIRHSLTLAQCLCSLFPQCCKHALRCVHSFSWQHTCTTVDKALWIGPQSQSQTIRPSLTEEWNFSVRKREGRGSLFSEQPESKSCN